MYVSEYTYLNRLFSKAHQSCRLCTIVYLVIQQKIGIQCFKLFYVNFQSILNNPKKNKEPKNIKPKTKEPNILNKIATKKAGQSFLYAYSKINDYINNNIFIKIILFIVGLCLILIGIMLLFIPGPGLLLLLIGSLLLCVSSKKIAIFLDKLENRLRNK